VELARAVMAACTKPASFKFTYPLDTPLKARCACAAPLGCGGSPPGSLTPLGLAAMPALHTHPHPSPPRMAAQDKIEAIARSIYGAGAVEFSPEAEASLELYTRQGFGGLPVCMAKTQYSFS
jgi:formyltetrahydrofolate synthetase